MKNLSISLTDLNKLAPTGTDCRESFSALVNMANATPDNYNERKQTLLAKRGEIADLWRKSKELEFILKNFKELTESAIGMLTDEDGTIAGLENHFKWQKGAVRHICNDAGYLFKIALANGITPEEIGQYIKSVNMKDAAKMLGMSEENFMNQYKDIVETKENKPTLKGL